MQQILYLSCGKYFTSFCRKQSTKSVLESRCFEFFFFVEILEKHQRRISFFHTVASWRAIFLLERLLKSRVVTNGFKREPQLATKQSCYFKKHHFFQQSFRSYFYRLYCLLYYSASLWINLLSSICAYTFKFVFPSLLKLAC